MLARFARRSIAALASAAILAVPAAAFAQGSETAQGAKDAGSLSLELNRAVDTDQGCRLGFVTTNKTGVDLAKAAFEVVLFKPGGLIDRLLVLDFGAMDEGRTKVREFNLSGADCKAIDRVLVNDVAACEGADGGEAVDKNRCMSALAASSKADIAFGL
ncbi:hypothetical protein DYI37_09755 [Fulvimarina endophytica]|uniref:Tat pathway signal sequence domain protein n=1 Tax=Fulvimarina endophytica TaxID=2293836 RepID=A0A371X295_9HYPH|nr:hypothetical protein [Fulvimarina endophytica]RFC63329.1 hypothetical protein DYI37_09755 [Fulvimarina endophytica]